MKKLSKNTFAKLFATFLGASTILTPLVTIVSCQPISKSPIIKQTEKKPNPGTPETPKPNPGNPNPTDPLKDIVETTGVDKNNQKKYILSGSFNIDDIEKVEEKIEKYGTTSVEIKNFNINCFSIKQERITTQSTTSRNAAPSTISYESKTITPKVLKKVLELKGINNNTILTLNNNSTIRIPFESSKTDYFDITDLAKFSFSDNFKITENSEIFLRAERTVDPSQTEDHTKYAKITELLSLINNPKIKHKITVGKVQLRGNVKDLLPYLVDGPNKIKETDGGITFGGAVNTSCTGEFWTGYSGIINDNGDINNTGRSILRAEEFLELKKRSNKGQSYVRNAIITGLDSKNLSPEQLKNAQFDHDLLTNVNFKNCDLSKIYMRFVGGQGTLKFENTVLPLSMKDSAIGTLTLKNATLPEELKTISLKKLFGRLPSEIITLKIYNLQGRFLDQYTEEKIKQIKKQWQNYGNIPAKLPERYAGQKDVWEKLKLLSDEETPTRTYFTNEDLTDVDNDNINFSAIQKPQDTFLALLGKNNSRG